MNSNVRTWTLLSTGAAIVLITAIAFLLLRAPTEKPRPASQRYIPPPSELAESSPVAFTDVTTLTGVRFVHVGGGFRHRDGRESRYMPETMGAGVAVFDYDGDSDLDIFAVNSLPFTEVGESAVSPASALFRNDGALRFTDVSRTANANVATHGMGATAADYDGDGHRDLLITSWGGVRLLRNRGDGTFADVTAAAGLADTGWRDDRGHRGPSWTTGAVFFDANADDTLDLFVAHYVQWSPETDLFATIDGRRKSYAKPDIYRGSSCRLYLQRRGRFVEVTATSGVLKENAKALGVALWDFNADGRLDVVVANDTQPNFLFEAAGPGTFAERALQYGIAYDENGATRAGMGIDIADYRNDGTAGIAIGNFSREPVSLFSAVGPAFYREVSQRAGVAAPTFLSLTFGLAFADVDLDGWQDLVMVNGHIEPTIQEVEAEISYRQPTQILGNDRHGSFVDWSATSGEALRQPIVGRGLAVGDLDSDGDLDLVITENSGPLRIYRNDLQMSERSSLRISLVGLPPNTDAIGAEISVDAGGQVQRRMVRTGSSYASQSELTQTFGLGQASVDRIRVRWPGGNVTTIDDGQVKNRVLAIRQTSREVIASQPAPARE